MGHVFYGKYKLYNVDYLYIEGNMLICSEIDRIVKIPLRLTETSSLYVTGYIYSRKLISKGTTFFSGVAHNSIVNYQTYDKDYLEDLKSSWKHWSHGRKRYLKLNGSFDKVDLSGVDCQVLVSLTGGIDNLITKGILYYKNTSKERLRHNEG